DHSVVAQDSGAVVAQGGGDGRVLALVEGDATVLEVHRMVLEEDAARLLQHAQWTAERAESRAPHGVVVDDALDVRPVLVNAHVEADGSVRRKPAMDDVPVP